MEQNIKAICLMNKLTSGKGRTKLNKLINQIKKSGLTVENSQIFTVYKQNSPNPKIIPVEPDNKIYLNLVMELDDILLNDMIQPQMITDSKYYIPIYDDDFIYSGDIIKNSNLVHFFLSNDDSNKKIQILIQKGKTGYLADKFIGQNGKKFYDV
jgi:hypothetical protein